MDYPSTSLYTLGEVVCRNINSSYMLKSIRRQYFVPDSGESYLFFKFNDCWSKQSVVGGLIAKLLRVIIMSHYGLSGESFMLRLGNLELFASIFLKIALLTDVEEP